MALPLLMILNSFVIKMRELAAAEAAKAAAVAAALEAATAEEAAKEELKIILKP
jgi:hypothetical protein